ncbi:hypothetical protein ACFQ0B_18080 [Nonomuraea thailandensis]
MPGKVNAWMVTSYESVNEVLINDGTLFSKNHLNCPALHDGTIPLTGRCASSSRVTTC